MAQQIIIFSLYIIISILISLVFSELFGELIGRKILHILMFGTWSLYLHYLDHNLGLILAIVVNILLVLYSFITKKYNLLTYGLVLLYSILDKGHENLNTIRLLILSLADGLAPITATIFNKLNKKISNLNDKTYIGSITFLLTTFIILITHFYSLNLAILISVFLTLIEYIVKKNDNLVLYICMIIFIT